MSLEARHTALDWHQWSRRLVHELQSRSAVHDPAVARAFEQTPRHVFVPHFFDRTNQPRFAPTDESELSHWYDLIYRDEPLVTELDERRRPLSSSTAPWLMALMAEALQLRAGMSLLEIGTGTGYNAAILARLIAPGVVRSVEIQEGLASAARARLAAFGVKNVEVITGDGRSDWGAEVDRVIVTAGFSQLATNWWRALRRGDGRLVGNLRGELAGGVLVVSKDEQGRGSGRFVDMPNVGFTPLITDDRNPAPQSPPLTDRGTWSFPSSELELNELAPEATGFRFMLQLHQPTLRCVALFNPSRDADVRFSDSTGRSLRLVSEGSSVHAEGSRDLYEEIQRVWRKFCESNRPRLQDWGMRVSEDGAQSFHLR